MAITLVASTKMSGIAASPSVDTTGATLLVLVASGYVGTGTPTDSKSNTWTGLTERVNVNNCAGRIFYVANPTVGSGHTFTPGGVGLFPAVAVLALSGVVTTSPFDQQNGATAAGATGVSTGSITPAENDEVIIAGAAFYADEASLAIDNSVTLQQNQQYVGGVSIGCAIGYKVQTTAAAINPAWSNSNSIEWAAMIASFKASAVAGRTTKNTRAFPLGMEIGMNRGAVNI